MTLKQLLVLSAVTAGCGLAQSSSAALVDNLNNFDNISTFNYPGLTNNLDGTLTFARSMSSSDQGVDWGNNRSGHLSLSNENLLTVTPVGPVTGGYYNANILVFNSSGGYLAELHWLGDNNSSAVQTLDVAQFVASQNNPALSTAAEYFLRIRIDPWAQVGAAFTFDQFSAVAVPEPASGLLLLGGLPLLWAVRRRATKG